MGYADLILSEQSRDNDKQKCVGKFGLKLIFSRGVHLRNTSCVFLATPTLELGGYVDNQSKYRKSLTHFC